MRLLSDRRPDVWVGDPDIAPAGSWLRPGSVAAANCGARYVG